MPSNRRAWHAPSTAAALGPAEPLAEPTSEEGRSGSELPNELLSDAGKPSDEPIEPSVRE